MPSPIFAIPKLLGFENNTELALPQFGSEAKPLKRILGGLGPVPSASAKFLSKSSVAQEIFKSPLLFPLPEGLIYLIPPKVGGSIPTAGFII